MTTFLIQLKPNTDHKTQTVSDKLKSTLSSLNLEITGLARHTGQYVPEILLFLCTPQALGLETYTIVSTFCCYMGARDPKSDEVFMCGKNFTQVATNLVPSP